MMKGIFANRSALFQTGILFIMLLTGFSISMLVTPLVPGSDLTKPIEQPVFTLQCTQFISAILMFLFPAISTAWLCSEQPEKFLHLQKSPTIRLLLLASISMLLISPTISLSSYLNSQIQLPDSMASIEKWIRSTEYLATQLTKKMISEKNIFSFLINLVVIAVMAGITEEFLFRGALFSIIQNKIRNHHIVIWTIAITFSAIHFQFYGFIPRMLLGAYFGYLLYWTNNIWVPVFVHFLNNAIALVGMSVDTLKDSTFFSDEIPPENIVWHSIIAAICLFIFWGCTKVIQKNRQVSQSYRSN